MIGVDYNVLNQRGSPSWFSDIYANIPTAGYKGRMFISTDTFAFYRDTGTGWDLIGGPGTGTITGSGTSGQVSYFNGTTTLAGSNNLFWDITNNRLGIGTITPGQPLDIHSTGNTLVQLNNTSTGNSNISFQNQDVAKWRVGNVYNGGANSFNIENAGLLTNALSINSTTNNITLTASLQVDKGVILATGTTTFVAGSTTLNGNANGLTIGLGVTIGPTTTNYAHQLLFPQITPQSYTFPATTGTLALTSDIPSLTGYVTLATTQTISGQKTFSGGVLINSGSILLQNGVNATTIGYTGFGVSTSGAIDSFRLYFGNGNNSGFNFDNASNYTYTLPSATGTLALTSNLSSYLPLAGGTLSGTLNSNSLIYTTLNLKTDSSVAFKNISSGGTAPSSLAGYSQLFFDTYQLTIRKADNQIIYLRYPNSATTQTWDFNVEGYIAVQYNASQTTGGVSFVRSTGQFTQDATNFFWDDTNKRLGIGTNAPLNALQVVSSLGTIMRIGEASGTTGKQMLFGIDSTTGRGEIQAVWQGTANTPLGLNVAGGNVLVGTTTDNGNKLQVVGTSYFSSSIYLNSNLIFQNGGVDKWQAYAGSGGDFVFYNTLAVSWNVYTNSVQRMAISSGGNVTIGTSLAAANSFNFYQNYSAGQMGFEFYNASTVSIFSFNGNTQTITLKGLSGTGSRAVLADANGTLSAPVSDISVKQNIVPIGYGLNEILKMKPIWFDFIEEYKNYGVGRQNGNIAQEIEAIIPEAVFTTELTGKMGINYDQLHAVYIKAIQELNDKLVRNNIN